MSGGYSLAAGKDWLDVPHCEISVERGVTVRRRYLGRMCLLAHVKERPDVHENRDYSYKQGQEGRARNIYIPQARWDCYTSEDFTGSQISILDFRTGGNGQGRKPAETRAWADLIVRLQSPRALS